MKFIISKPFGTDSGNYSGMVNFQWESVVEGVYCNDKKKGIRVLGSEFIRCGGCPRAFKYPDKEYIWGSFEEVN